MSSRGNMQNPYKYLTPLHPPVDRLVCMDRTQEINRIVNGITRGSYWSILGPKYTGKTTLMFQIMDRLGINHHSIYIDLSMPPLTSEAEIYARLIQKIITVIPRQAIRKLPRQPRQPIAGLDFIDYLRDLQLNDGKRIIFFLDEIEMLPFIQPFLALWRKIFHDRNSKKALSPYSIVTAGSANLAHLTVSANSPFNIAESLYIKDLSEKQSHNLVKQPLLHLGINIEDDAVKKLWFELQGHCQLLQHAGFLIVQYFGEKNQPITVAHVEYILEQLLENNLVLHTLGSHIDSDETLRELSRDILAGKPKNFLPYKEYAIAGVGALKEDEKNRRFCALRNSVFQRFLQRKSPGAPEAQLNDNDNMMKKSTQQEDKREGHV